LIIRNINSQQPALQVSVQEAQLIVEPVNWAKFAACLVNTLVLIYTFFKIVAALMITMKSKRSFLVNYEILRYINSMSTAVYNAINYKSINSIFITDFGHKQT